MKVGYFLLSAALSLSLYGCSEEAETNPAAAEAQTAQTTTQTETAPDNINEDVTRFVELYVKFQSVSNVETATNNQLGIKNSVKADWDEIESLLAKYNSYTEDASTTPELMNDFRDLLEHYSNGLSFYIDGVETNDYAYISQGFKKFVEVGSLLEDLTVSLEIPFDLGIQESFDNNDETPGLLEATSIKNALETSFGKDILINNISYNKFTSVNQYELDEEQTLSLEVITDSLNKDSLENYGSKDAIKEELENVLLTAFNNDDIDKVGITFLLDFNGTILPTYSIAFSRQDFQSWDFDSNSFELIVGYFGSDFSEENLSQSYTIVNEEEEANDSAEVKEPVFKEETPEETEEKEEMHDLLESTNDFWGELNAEEWNQKSDEEQISLVRDWISEYENQGGIIEEDPEWFITTIEEAINYYGTSLAENGETLHVLVGSVIFQHLAFGGMVSQPFR